MAELEILSFVRIANKLLLSQYKKPNFESLFKIISDAFDDIQTNNFELRDKFWLMDATGEQLEFIGRLWGESREAESDDDYRFRIIGKIAQSSSGTIQEIKNFLYGVFSATHAVYSSEYPAGFRMRTDASLTHEELEVISVSGVGSYVAGKIVDALGNPIIDALGSYIIHTDDSV